MYCVSLKLTFNLRSNLEVIEYCEGRLEPNAIIEAHEKVISFLVPISFRWELYAQGII